MRIAPPKPGVEILENEQFEIVNPTLGKSLIIAMDATDEEAVELEKEQF